MFKDRKYQVVRDWSNVELKKFAHLFSGDIGNISGRKDSDKQGSFYKDYFINASSYTITNFVNKARGFQGTSNEIFLDLEKDLEETLINKFDVVFNHTTLEHIYEIRKAFSNLCLMTKDICIVVVPFLQEMHAEYGDYRRPTPLAIKKMYEENGMELMYLSFNEDPLSSIYIFAIGSKKSDNRRDVFKYKFSYYTKESFYKDKGSGMVGNRSIGNTFLTKLYLGIKYNIKKLLSR